LHAVAALMVALILRRLRVPGAYLAAAIFALHPIQVESVAWITELKNTLSAVFYLGAAMVYLRFDQTRKTPLYLWALGLFVLGLLSKTVTATLPAALLVIFWWQRGGLSWKKDVAPLIPFFVFGAIAGLSTAWVERKLIGAEGAAFELSVVERFLLAGRAIWFYLGKLVWPTELTFIYPRWQLSQAVWWQYLYLAAALLLLAALWGLRRRWRGPLAGMLYFAGTLFPVLGFCNVYPFIYSFVADHFQYLASLGIITLASAGVAVLLTRWQFWGRPVGYGLCLVLLATLGTLTWRQSWMYADIETLYRTTIDRNPNCWLAEYNLGNALVRWGRTTEAIAHYQTALEIKPDCAEAHNNLGAALAGRGQVAEAMAHYRKAMELRPNHPDAYNNLGATLARCGQVGEAIVCFQKALQIKPDFVNAHANLATALADHGQVDEAVAHYRKVLEIEPNRADAHTDLGLILAHRGQVDEAIAHFQKAVEAKPDDPEAHNNLAVALARRGRLDEAISHFHRALQIRPQFVEARRNLDRALIEQRQIREGAR
jgi:protein O-mannosyl-transferase